MNKKMSVIEAEQQSDALSIYENDDLPFIEPKKVKLLSYGATKSQDDYWDAADAAEGVQIFGGTGSGKTSGSGKSLAHSYLLNGFGGLVLAVKPDEVVNWKEYCAATGRENDLIIFSPDSVDTCCFNFLEYEKNRKGKSAGNVDNIVSLFMDVLEVAGRKNNNNSVSNPFFEGSLKLLLTNAIELINLSGLNELTLFDVRTVISSAGHHADDLSTKKWQNGRCATLLAMASARIKQDTSLQHDFEIINHYWLYEFPRLAAETRSIIEIMFTSLANIFLRNPMRDLFCNKTAITPDVSIDGKIIVIDMPVLEYNEIGLYANILWKLVWQRTIEKRDIKKNPRNVFLWADEAQYFINKKDRLFQTTARSQRICTVYLTQNLPNYVSVLGEEETMALLGNLNTKIFHSNTDKSTNEYASALIGRAYREKWTYNSSENVGTTSSNGSSQNWGENGGLSTNSNRGRSEAYTTGSSVSDELEYQVLPENFASLMRGGGDPPVVEGIVFQMGKNMWPISQSNFLYVGFNQNIAGEIEVYNEVIENKIPGLTLKSFLRVAIMIRFFMLLLISFVVFNILGFSGAGLYMTSFLVASVGAIYIVREKNKEKFT